MKTKIAIQGIKGSFHHQVAQEYFGAQTEVLECMSFPILSDYLLQEEVTHAVMAIENSIAGSIIPNYALVDNNHLCITGEYYLNIHHNLMALENQEINAIKEVHSHPMALLQCADFFKKHPHIKLVEDVDTAATAKRISEQQLKGIAAIASSTASVLYELPILVSGIQTVKNNATRFFILERENPVSHETTIDKASLKFELEHKRGSLATVLNVMSDCKLNLTKIQSLPKIEMPWKYAFFVDVTFNTYNNYQKAVKLISIMADHFKILGEYKNTQHL